MVLPDVPVDGTLWTKEFWKATAERAIRTGAIAAALTLIGDAYETLQVNALTIDWLKMIGFFFGGALLSVLMSVGAHAKTGRGPSFLRHETLTAPRRAMPDEIPRREEP